MKITGLLILAVLILTGCQRGQEAVRRCVDEGGTPVDNKNCENPPASGPHHYTWAYERAAAPVR